MVAPRMPRYLQPRLARRWTNVDKTSYIVLVRIGRPARKHGVSDEDIWHAVRNAVRRVMLDEDLTMLIGPAVDGSLLEIGVLDAEGEDPVVIHAMPMRGKFARLLSPGR